MAHPWQVNDVLTGYFWDEPEGKPFTFSVVHRTKCFVTVLQTDTGSIHRKKVNQSTDNPFFWLGGLVIRRYPRPEVNRARLLPSAPSSGVVEPVSVLPCPAAQPSGPGCPST